MTRFTSRMSRGLFIVVAAVCASAIFSVASADATITQTAITTPTSPFVYQYNVTAGTPATATISGTTNSTAPGTDAVDINCYYGDEGSAEYITIASDVVTDASGAFSHTGNLDEDGYTCVLRAVPHSDTATGGLSAFTGPLAELDELDSSAVSGSAAPFYDYFDSATSSAVYNGYNSVGSCGLESEVLAPGYSYDDDDTWDCADALYRSDGFGRSEIQVDGQNAYDSDGAAGLYGGADTSAGFPGVTSSYQRGTSPDDATINESEGLVECPSASAYPATSTSCPAFASSGVSFARTIKQTAGGQVVTITDTYSSTNGAAHTVNLEYDNYTDVEDPEWQLPGATSFENYAGGDTASLPAVSNGVVYVKDGEYQDGSEEDGPGAIIYSTQPSSAQFYDSDEMLLDYQKTVPANGSVSITQTYITGVNQAAVQKLVSSTSEQTVKPTVAITGPAANATTANSSVQVSGMAAAYAGLTLKVNGEAVGVNPDGSWSTSVSLNAGANTITATASDDSGNTAQASETVTYTPVTPTTTINNPPATAPQFCVVPNVSRTTLSKAKAALKAAHCGLGKVSTARSKTYGKGKIEHASASAGQVFASNAKIGLTESVGNPKKHKAKKHSTKKHTTKK